MAKEFVSPNGGNAAPATGMRRRPGNIWLIVVAALFIIVPFLTWYFTWFGRALSDEKIAEYLSDEKHPRNIQHALLQVEQKIEKGDPAAKNFYPQIIAASKSSVPEVRKTAAWVMGQDNRSEEFHRALVELLKDAEPLVRRNGALQLIRFGDASGRPELRAMLQPFEAKSPFAGTIVSLLSQGSPIKAGGLLARIRDETGNVQEFRSAVGGAITNLALKEGAAVSPGQTVASINPDRSTILDGLSALAYVGTTEDLALVESIAQADASSEVGQQAVQTAKAIRARGK
jgi:HEAT repeats